ncbi:MAG: SGNH/GDSL hydrolase family protein [Bacteroidetes bacterium]|nr:SGNH/GDSL hydrolase family protein [Fibrella sp.]
MRIHFNQHRPSHLLFGLILLLITTGLVWSQTSPSTEARECRVREGLPHFFRKLNAGGVIKIAYIGGSITEAKGGWREQTQAWFQKTYPSVIFTQISAGVGGTGSDLGVFRLRQEVLAQHPDLVFIEFAVNDGTKPARQIHQAMEGMVRQIWQQDPTTEVCFIYTLTAGMGPTLQEGKFPASVVAMEQVAGHYGIPTIHVGVEVVALAKSGRLVYRGKPEDYPNQLVFSGDDVHPYPQTGHRLYTEAIVRSMRQLEALPARPPHRLGTPFVADHWQKARMVSMQGLPRNAGWREVSPDTDSVARQVAKRFSYLLKSTQAEASLTFRFRGTQVGLYDVMGPGCGQYSITLDGQPLRLQPRFDEYCTYYRSNYFLVSALPDGEHTVTFSVSAKPLDKVEILKKRNNTMDTPSRYAEQACYAGQLLLVGELLE